MISLAVDSAAGSSLKEHVTNLSVLGMFRGHITALVKAELRRENTFMLHLCQSLVSSCTVWDLGNSFRWPFSFEANRNCFT